MSSAIVDKYIGESARVIREMFGYARDHQPCVIFMDEIDAIGGRRFSEGTSADREIQRTLMELLSQMDGFDVVGKVGGPGVMGWQGWWPWAAAPGGAARRWGCSFARAPVRCAGARHRTRNSPAFASIVP